MITLTDGNVLEADAEALVAVNLVKLVPIAGRAAGAGLNVVTMKTFGTYAKRNLPQSRPVAATSKG